MPPCCYTFIMVNEAVIGLSGGTEPWFAGTKKRLMSLEARQGAIVRNTIGKSPGCLVRNPGWFLSGFGVFAMVALALCLFLLHQGGLS